MNDDLTFLRRAVELSREARARGDHPFGALLLSAEGKVLAQALNSVGTSRDCTGHAEINLMREASARFPPSTLRNCTLYSSAEPCAMCAGAIYWGGVGRVVYALSEARLLALTGDHPENPTLRLPCREVFEKGQRDITVLGPFIEDEAAAAHEGFWA